MIETRWSRLAPLSGVAFFVLLAVSMFVLERSTPDSTASTASVVSYYDNHSSREMGAGSVHSGGSPL